jgi:hypothetical protein
MRSIVFILFFTLSTAVSAATSYAFQYQFDHPSSSMGLLSGTLIGELQGDGDTVLVTSVEEVAYSLDAALIFSTELIDGFGAPTVSFSGDQMNFGSVGPGDTGLAGWLVSIHEPFLLANRAVVVGPDGIAIDFSEFNSASWSLQVVPIPAAVWLFGSALAGLGWMRRKQAV